MWIRSSASTTLARISRAGSSHEDMKSRKARVDCLDRYTGRNENFVLVARGERTRIAVLGARTRAEAIQSQPAKGGPRRGISRASPWLVGFEVQLRYRPMEKYVKPSALMCSGE